MIGAMPAVAVRHERRRQEKRTKRPNQLYLGGAWLPGAPHHNTTPSPSPSTQYGPSPGCDVDGLPEYYLCGKVSALQVVVCLLLLGAIVLVVGLVQLSPGAEAADHRYLLLGAGGAILALGLILTAVRCCCLSFMMHRRPLAPHGEDPDCVGISVAPEHRAISSIDRLVAATERQSSTEQPELDALLIAPPDVPKNTGT